MKGGTRAEHDEHSCGDPYEGREDQVYHHSQYSSRTTELRLCPAGQGQQAQSGNQGGPRAQCGNQPGGHRRHIVESEKTGEVSVPGIQESHPPEAEDRGHPGDLDSDELRGQTLWSRNKRYKEDGNKEAGRHAAQPVPYSRTPPVGSVFQLPGLCP